MEYKLDSELFIALAKENRKEYVKAKPFPHIVLDGLFPNDVLYEIIKEFPNKAEVEWEEFKDRNQVKLATRDEQVMGPFTRQFIHILNSGPFLNFLEELTGIQTLIPDPNLEGGGLHQIMNGGLLKVHADFNKHPKTNLDRRLNVLLYLNDDWGPEFGGHFELWDKDMTKAEVRLLPLFNRLVVFSTTSFSYHGHPDPVTCPENLSRKSIAMYYYTNGRPKEEENFAHTTVFKMRKDVVEDKKGRLKNFLRELIPPIVMKTYIRFKK